ncbi:MULTISPECIES: YaeQ family protein [Vibrio]|jgi:uncharacterized protein YaeQ|uniref:Uncharacterized protein YaeQ n=1 Tax=Vibrio diazotrophicus TaxID=685 RepID=A0A2J8G5V5_VIBDI|nr:MULTISPECIES: YaeQ family protein [Vibrio]MCF7361602.1 YaeQ family protein [Vibrio sp. A1-b2]MCZ4372875.1 YaeQ family protein [Vibrio diazotrophicus]PNH81399.1 hypothetical protein C1N27_07605 [Vibrio diazotrophicus]PNI05799.1 hypothetical protein C1N32_06825 [Vibrio diazotrophicus]RAS66409.1 uncharacterized protein YaeQ [Vibrio diazotrophicus]
MALKPTIYKFRIALTDLNRDYYDSLNLTVALHPSETNERMMARIMAFCLNAHPDLQFTKGISTTAEPDIWQQNLEGRSEVWIELGEPDVDRVKKATRVADVVKVYTYQVRSDIWWNQHKGKFGYLPVEVVRFDPEAINLISASPARTVDLSVMITGQSLFVEGDMGSHEIAFEVLQNLPE